jgi:hypothetical protein
LGRTYTKEEFVTRAIKIHGNKYDYSKVKYKNSKTNLCIICPTDGEFLQKPSDHLSGHGCPKCGGTTKLTTEEFITKANKVHDNKYDYRKVDYKNCDTEVIIGCPIDGYFSQTPTNHLQGRGCPLCQISHGEKQIAKILDNKKIEYIKQKTFPDCINPKTKYKLKFDFDLSTKHNILIEFNGIQHYKSINYWHQDKNTLEDQQYRDRIKKQYALSHGYKFIVIKYNDNVEEILNKEIFNNNSQKTVKT